MVIIGFLLISIGSYLFYKSYALYEESKSFDVISGTVEDPGDIYFAYYIDGEISREMPKQNTGYTLDEAKSNCNNNVTVTWDNASWEAKVNHKNYSATTNTRTKCTLYFNKTSKTVSTALGNIEVSTYTPDFTKSACDDESCESHEKGIYETKDYDGNPTYYYRGSVENNYVKFAGFYWRIIRINSNGSIRMIYDGTTAHANGESSTNRFYKKTAFNSTVFDPAIAGYMYTLNSQNGLTTSSNIKIENEQFYVSKLKDFESKLDINIVFCGDRSILSHDSTDNDTTYYNSYYRFSRNDPDLLCDNTEDLYTSSNSSIGNKALTYSIGLATMDEYMYAGFSNIAYIPNNANNQKYFKPNVNSYLSIGTISWTMTPAGYFNPAAWQKNYAMVFSVDTNLWIIDTRYEYALRPVINIRSDVTITGSGTMSDPYIIN